MSVQKRCVQGVLAILLLALAIEILYAVPYGLTGSFRPMLREAFGLSNTEVGRISSMYGLVNMIMYAPGGYIADLYPPKTTITAALLVTAACAFYLTKMTSSGQLVAIWAILAVVGSIFWSAFVAAIRQVGGEKDTGKAFGFEQFSRGVISSLLTLFLVSVLEKHKTEVENTSNTSPGKQPNMAVLLYMLASLASATSLLVCFCVGSKKEQQELSVADDEKAKTNKESDDDDDMNQGKALSDLGDLLKQPSIWLHSVIIVAAYCANLACGYFSGFAKNAYGFDNIRSAQISTLVTWTRACAGLLAGLAADRFGRSKICAALFIWTMCAYAWVAFAPIDASNEGVLKAQIVSCAAGAYGIAGVYFTLLDDARLPLHLTATAVGIISVVGFTPDIFLAQVAGFWMDKYPGAQGYQYFYRTILGIELVGLIATLGFAYVVKGKPEVLCDSASESSLGSDAD